MEREIKLTIAHEFAHSLAEAMDHFKSCGLDAPDWRSIYGNDDEEMFAEGFASELMGMCANLDPKWEDFILRVIALYEYYVERWTVEHNPISLLRG